jgi:hypothetical protein
MAECECELNSQSKHCSPGVVQDAETVIRLIYAPDQIDADGSLIAARFNKDEFQRPADGGEAKVGFSTFREAYAGPDQLMEVAQEACSKFPAARAEAWAYHADVTGLRQELIAATADNDDAGDASPPERALCVVDRALPDDRSHAEIWGSAKRPPSKLRMVRDQTLQRFRRHSRIV